MTSRVENLETIEIIRLYSEILIELKERKVIRSKNLVGELGEYLAVELFNSNEKLPNLKLAPTSNKSYDATDESGKTYAIKTTTGNVTGVFYGLNSATSKLNNKQIFDFAIIVKLNENYEIEKVIQLDWNQFIHNKKWHSRMRAWNLNLSKKLELNCKIIT
ncbi:DUF6998 domain-containing protein [Chryseobacterium schmidteae]|uniref:DUF6998 domain-containing protein n=1 Tax=Chryseobacterium schmidteae TaxID=2730404 RepID=UPI00158CE38B|nr:hypothetical protein [Chryseobacterium schmidteae]